MARKARIACLAKGNNRREGKAKKIKN